ncbi:MAG TPA: hypothetical protein VLJ83_10015, partial [Gemmatimonadaceae bacterium]|nr:hypothetical protein [Gemmatimonadaceae bacterium]
FTGTASLTATVELKCTNAAGVKITPTAFGSSLCTITVAAQKVGGHVTFKNIANGDVTGETTLNAISSTRTFGGELCGPAADAAGTYIGNVIIESETGSTPFNISVT